MTTVSAINNYAVKTANGTVSKSRMTVSWKTPIGVEKIVMSVKGCKNNKHVYASFNNVVLVKISRDEFVTAVAF